MIILYDSMTGNCKRFAKKLGELTELQVLPISEYKPDMGKYLLVTYTIGRGGLSAKTANFLSSYSSGIIGVCSSGTINWGELFAKAGDIISERYNTPLVLKFNKSGTAADLDTVRRWIEIEMD